MRSIQTWVSGLSLGPYSLVKELARGGMGEIWLARQTGQAGFDRLVVLKRVLHSGDEDSAAMTMFLDEARIASQLHHPNIVQIFDLRTEGSSTFLVMEYLVGQTVNRLARRLVERDGSVPAHLAVSIIAAAAKGLGYAHRKVDLAGKPLHIVHRDVAPQNLFITYDGEVKVLDFGIARAAGRMGKTATGIIKGRISYMSPEQASAEPVSGASDVYALGVILFELVTGTRLYRDADDMAILRRLAVGAPIPRASSRRNLDGELDDLIARALEPSPADRFSDGQAFFEALERWKRDHPADGPSLTEAMESSFAKEMDDQKDLLKDVALTPVSSSGSSMPDRSPEAVPPPRARWPLFVGLGSVLAIGAVGAAVAFKPSAPPSPGVAVVAAPLPPPPLEEEPPIPDAGRELAIVETPPPPPAPLPGGPGRVHLPNGALTLDTEPWTTVFLGSRVLGDTPLINLSLPAGTHRLRFKNPSENIDRTQEVVIKPRETTVKKLTF